MPKSRIPSPARSQGVISTPRKQLRRTGSVTGSPGRTNLRLSKIIDSYKVSPVPNRLSVLNDDTDIEMPRRASWWKKIDDNSRDVLELLERKEAAEINNVAEEFDVEILSQENKHYTLDLPESSDGESINSIVIPHKKLFTQKDIQPQIQFGNIKNNRETLQKLNKSHVDQENDINIERKTLFSQPSKPRTKPVFPAALLNVSVNKTDNKSKEISAAGVKGQVRHLFGSRPGTKRKNMFADFIVSESEDEISEIQPKVFGFQKRKDQKRRASSMSRHSPTSSIDLEMDEWKLLPSSTMVENQIDEATSPVKRMKLSNVLETKESEKSTNSNNTLNITKQANKSVSSKNKSKNRSNIHHDDDKCNDVHMTPKNATTNNSRVTRSMHRSLRESSVTKTNISKHLNISKNQTQSNQDSDELQTNKSIKNVTQKDSGRVLEKQNMLTAQPDSDEDFTLDNDNDHNEVAIEIGNTPKNYNKSHKDKTTSNLNADVIEDRNNLVKKSSGKISQENLVELGISTNKIYENQEKVLENKESNIDSNKVSNYLNIQNSSQEIRNVVGSNEGSTNVQKLNETETHSVENYNEPSRAKDMRRKTLSQEKIVNEDTEKYEKSEKSTQKLNQENCVDQEMESDNENNYEQHTDIEEEANETTQGEGNNVSEIAEEMNEDEHQENDSPSENISEEEANFEDQEEIDENNPDKRDKEMILDDQHDNKEDKNQATLPNVSHDTTGRHRKEIKSPEVILHDKTKQIDSFTVQGRNTSVRKTKSVIFHNKLDTVADSRRSTGFSDATGNSTAEGSGWDSHRTTRKTLRQTFGKDFTPRKSLRALVMEKTAKLQANFTDIANNTKFPQANSTEYEQVQNELDFYQETELVQVEQNIKMVQAEERIEAIQLEANVTERLEERDKKEQLEERNRTERIEERYEADQSKNVERDETELSEIIAETEQPEERETEQSEERDETEHFEEREEMEESEEGEEMEESDGAEMEKSEEREDLEKSEEREDWEQSEEREVVAESEEEDRIEQSEENEVTEESEEEEEMEQSEENGVTEESEEEEEMEQSEEGEQMEQSAEREETEQSENEERDETEQFAELGQSENEIENFEEGDETVADDEKIAEVPDREDSKQTRQTSLETYLHKIKQDNAEKRRKMQEELRNSLKNPKRDAFNLFKVPQRPVRRTIKKQRPEAKQIKSVIPLELLPSEIIEDMKYKPPKRFQPNNASWITKRLYKFLENKLEPKYDYKARVRAEKLVQCIYNFTKEVRRHDSIRFEGIEELKREMARLDIVKTHFDFYEFCHEFFPREIRIKVVPDIVNNIQLPRHGVFSDILR